MATVFTHAFVGAALATTGPAQISRPRLGLALALASMFPDIDVLAFALDIPYAHPLGHRGLSHSLPFALLCAVIVTRLGFSSVSLRSRHGIGLVAAFTLAMGSHGLLDAVTDGGLGVAFWSPFDTERYFLPWQFLQVSPIGAQAFFSGPALQILVREVLYVWLPVSLLLLSFWLVARIRRSSFKA